MRRLGRGFGRTWKAEDWFRAWEERRPQPPTAHQLMRRNEIQRFRLVLARKEPKS